MIHSSYFAVMTALSTLLAQHATAFGAPAAQEQIPTDEPAQIEEISRISAETLLKDHKDEPGSVPRDAHAKAHGCLRGQFQVDASLPDDLKAGVFKDGASYKAWIRYSNGSPKSSNDKDPDGRGMAIKLMGVAGDKLLEDERGEQTQDLIMINHPVFFIRNVADYIEFSKATFRDKNPLKFFFPGLNPLKWHAHEANIARQIASEPMSNPLASPYWSETPYLLGQSAIKFAVQPCSGQNLLSPLDRSSPNFLRETMARQLAAGGACFDFSIQMQKDPTSMPIEDPTIEWSEQSSPYRHVASLKIPAQVFNSAAELKFCEDLSFTPWHSLAAHRPLGGINRARKAVYQTISKVRHQMNNAPRKEPTGDEVL